MMTPGCFWKIAWVICIGLAFTGVSAQTTDTPEAPPGMVTLNFPENVDLKVLIDYVGKRQGVNFIYDEQVGARRVTIKAPQPVPAESLMMLLESALKMNGLAISPTDVPGMMRIQVANQLTTIAVGPGPAAGEAGQARPTLAITRVFELQHAGPQRVEQVIRPFLSATTANLTVLPEHGLVIVTDYADNVTRLEELIAVVDRPKREVSVRFVAIKHLEAAAMAQKVTLLLAGKAKARGGAADTAAVDVTVLADERTNQVAVVGVAGEVNEAITLIESLDVPLGMETKVYTFSVASADQVDQLVRKLIGELTAKRLYESATDRDANLLIATTTPEIHRQIEELRGMLDKPVAESQNPIRFYKLENAKAVDVLETLRSIEGDTGLGNVSVDGVSADQRTPPGYSAIKGPTEDEVNRVVPSDDSSGTAPELSNKSLELPNARVMADEATNTIIVVARPSIHAVYEKLIQRLDVRRPQVLVEATVMLIDTTDGFELGVEIHTSESVDSGELLNFTSFGLTKTDTTTGALTLTPGIGFTGALLSADIAEVVIRALESDKRVKVVSRPSVLINDNATGTLLSESEEPYSTVNASGVAGATTSFGGFASAGTNIKITPQISEGDHLKLEYEITLSSFGERISTTEADAATLPPSRQTNSLTSEATIPDGHTIVVGGLTRENYSETVDKVPILGSIPIVEYLFSSRTKSANKATLYVFIRAVILRDDKFEDLKIVSGQAASEAGLAGDYPVSEPAEVR